MVKQRAISSLTPLAPPQTQEVPPRIPAPSHRHASPSGPWPWQDLDYETRHGSPQVSLVQEPLRCSHEKGECDGGKYPCWAGYPQSLFANWTPGQVMRSRIKEICAQSTMCTIYHVDVGDDGHFWDAERHSISDEDKGQHMSLMNKERPEGTRVRVLFLENLSVPVMGILGTKYKIEPFYFSSSLNWIPSRYQEEMRQDEGDHITITLPFLRAVRVPPVKRLYKRKPSIHNPNRQFDQTLRLDLLALHMIRNNDSSTILSYHPLHGATSARQLHSRVSLAGESVYWQTLFQQSSDPTLVLLSIMWYALYAWDESLSMLWEHIGQLELSVITTHNIMFTQELHQIRAHLLYYVSILEDFHKAVIFIRETPNPAMNSGKLDDAEQQRSKRILGKECRNLEEEIEKLKLSRDMQDKRLKNVMDLAFSIGNTDDSNQMRQLTEAALKDSAAMKQISYLTMVFLPASFSASIFGMNIEEITPNTLGSVSKYLATALPLTAITIWIIVAFQGKWHTREGEEEPSISTRLSWPLRNVNKWIRQRWDTHGWRW
ncbi:hypothetical protein K439DRAFT_1337830 [Ramaria rubella]|nr:hypothetical protein K439DRAFT_1337830 [Ramaria rubella]